MLFEALTLLFGNAPVTVYLTVVGCFVAVVVVVVGFAVVVVGFVTVVVVVYGSFAKDGRSYTNALEHPS